MNTISEFEYKALKTRHNAFEQWRNGRTSYKVDEVPAGLEFSNEDRSKIEIYEFINNPPDKYFAYVREPEGGSRNVQIVNWMGELLGNATLGTAYVVRVFGMRPTKRYPVLKFKAINGKWYYGTYYASSGNYCRLKEGKSK